MSTVLNRKPIDIDSYSPQPWRLNPRTMMMESPPMGPIPVELVDSVRCMADMVHLINVRDANAKAVRSREV